VFSQSVPMMAEAIGQITSHTTSSTGMATSRRPSGPLPFGCTGGAGSAAAAIDVTWRRSSNGAPSSLGVAVDVRRDVAIPAVVHRLFPIARWEHRDRGRHDVLVLGREIRGNIVPRDPREAAEFGQHRRLDFGGEQE